MTVEAQLISALAEVERLRKAVVGKDAEISRRDAEIKKTQQHSPVASP